MCLWPPLGEEKHFSRDATDVHHIYVSEVCNFFQMDTILRQQNLPETKKKGSKWVFANFTQKEVQMQA